MRPLEWRIMKAIFSVVTSWAAIMRSPSFSREGESSTIIKLPREKAEIQEAIESKAGWDSDLEGMVFGGGLLVLPAVRSRAVLA